MLILWRKKGHAVIAGPVKVTVLGIRGNVVDLGFEAPAEMPILRAELQDVRPPIAEAAVDWPAWVD